MLSSMTMGLVRLEIRLEKFDAEYRHTRDESICKTRKPAYTNWPG
jgi:hypothetical protein